MKKNLILLFLIQISNYIFPLISMPYLIRILGVTNYGIIAIFIALVQYVNIISDYGFSFTSTRKIAINKNNQDEVCSIFTSTIIAKFVILVLCMLVIYMYLYVNHLFDYMTLFYMGVIYCVFSVFEAVWLFQGLEKLNLSANITLISKSFSFFLIFILVDNQGDTLFAILCSLIGVVVSGFFSLFFIYKLKLSRLKLVQWRDISVRFKESTDMFISNMTISLYTTMNTLVLGYVYGPTIVGYFSAADKIRLAAQGLLTPVQQILFPKVTIILTSGGSFQQVLNTYGYKVIGLGLFISSMLFIFGYPFSLIYFGETFMLTGKILLVLSPIPFIVSIGIVFGQWRLIGVGNDKGLRNIYVLFSFMHILLMFPFIYFFENYGVATSILVTEFFISLTFIYLYLKLDAKQV